MSIVMQNIIFGSEVPHLDNEDQWEEIINDCENVTTFYNGNDPRGSGGEFIAVEIQVLQDEGIFDITGYLETMDQESLKEAFNKKLEAFKNSEIFEDEVFKDFALNAYINDIKPPRLLIVAETD